MKTSIIHNPRVKTLAIATALIIGGTLFGAAVFQPASQPAKTVSAYTLQDTNLAKVGDAGTRAYRAWYEDRAWQGDLIEYDISQTGARSTDVRVGYSPPSVPSDADGDGHTNWSVRSVFAAAEGQSADANTTDPVQYDGDVTGTCDGFSCYWKEGDYPTGRRIFTVVDGVQEPFLWTNLNSTQKTALDSTADPDSADGYASTVLNFIRGDRSNEFPQGRGFRVRWNLMGDVIRSQPVYVSEPVANFTLDYYADYKTRNSGDNKRAGRVYVGANDGMLHAFNATNGSEVFAYIPSMVVSELPNLTARPYLLHSHFVDSDLYAGDVCPNGCVATVVNDEITVNPWMTILAGGLGAGGKGLWALDITDPAYAADETKVIWEKASGDAMGYIYNRPQAALLPDDKWYVVSGNGYGSVSGDDALFLFSLDTGGTSITHAVTTNDDGNGLSGITLVDINADFKADLGYAGDLKGNVYKFQFLPSSDTDPAGATCATSGSLKVCHSLLIATGVDHPITISPDVGRHPNGGYLVYFGTGSLLSQADAENSITQRVYAVWDSPNTTAAATDACGDTEGQLACQTLHAATYSYTYEDALGTTQTSTKDIRYPTGSAPNWSVHRGWRVDLPVAGERLIGNPQLRAEHLQFITTNPTVTDVDSWLFALDYRTGAASPPPNDVVYDLNQDGELNSGDKVTVSGTTYVPVALNLGPGNLSQPTIARIGGGVDIHFINGLLLPPAAPEFLGGLLDVTTDSPYGGAGTDLFGNMLIDEGLGDFCRSLQVATADCPGSPGNPVDTTVASNGIGGLPDGHVHAYDKVHGVSYVDYLELEPRRGLARLDVYTGDTDASGDWALSDTVKTTYTRLNRLGAYDAEGDAWEDPEPYADGSDQKPRLDPDTKFVVLLANADLSPGAVLQIGCRTWLVQEYQDMITNQLTEKVNGIPTLSNIPPNELDDTIHNQADSLVFTLNDIRNGSTCAAEDNAVINAMGITKSESPTLRISFNDRVAQTLGILPTLPACVWGIQDPLKDITDADRYFSPSEYQLGHLTPVSKFQYCTGNPDGDYILNYCIDPADPYADPADADAGDIASAGYRWRNGALTMQLLAVGDGTSSIASSLQPPSGTYIHHRNPSQTETVTKQYLPNYETNRVNDLIGGLIARAFKAADETGTPVADPDPNPTSSNLLYESAIFFDAGAFLDYKTGNRGPSCYGAPNYNSQLIQEVVAGMNWGKYQALTAVFFDEEGQLNSIYEQYVAYWTAVLTAETEEARQSALNNLAEFFANNPDVKLYDKLRNFVGEKVWEQEGQHQDEILPIDQYSGGVSADDTPEQVEDISQDLTPVLGPNFITGRRTWIDLRP